MFAPATIAAERASPNGIKLLDERIDECWIVGENAVLEVAFTFGLRAHARAGEIGAAAQSRR